MRHQTLGWEIRSIFPGLVFVLIGSLIGNTWAQAPETIEYKPIPRVLPRPGIEVPDLVLKSLQSRLNKLINDNIDLVESPYWPDAAVFIKAVQFAIELNEFYVARDFEKAHEVLELAEERFKQIREKDSSWREATGLVVRGYMSSIDRSYQPYGLEIPVDWTPASPPSALYVWLHGRSDSGTDMHFVQERRNRRGSISVPDAFVLHAFGRQCLGFKSAGEIDVLEAIDAVSSQYSIDPARVVLIGFSMGGAGAWHLGAHYTDRFVGVFPGAGFAETARYQKINPETYSPSYEKTLWSIYDVPGYVRNLFNIPVIAYSGENDPQMQAATVMAEAFQAEGKNLTHLIGPNTAHAYELASLRQLLERVKQIRDRGQDLNPDTLSLQTRTWRYGTRRWFAVQEMQEQYADTRIDAQRVSEDTWQLKTLNVASMMLYDFPGKSRGRASHLQIDDQKLDIAQDAELPLRLERGERWTIASSPIPDKLVKQPGLSGPIDDAFLDPFLVVIPTRVSPNAQINKWVEFELAHFRSRWQAVFRGHPRMKRDTDVTDDEIRDYHLLCWGDPSSNAVLERIMKLEGEPLPLKWNAESISVGSQAYIASRHIPAFIYPNPLNKNRYLVVNSGPTFREAHDRTNSQQNPKLPDWVIFDITQPPNDRTAGRVVAADFFDTHWQLSSKPK